MMNAIGEVSTVQTIPQALRKAAEQWPDQEALVIRGERVSYAELLARTQSAAANLYRLGLRPGDHFAICASNRTEWVVAAYAAAWLGAVVVPVNTRFKADELSYCLRQSDSCMLLIEDRFLSIDFMAMLRSVAPALDMALPDPALPKLRTVLVLGQDVPAAALSATELERTDVPPAPKEVAPTKRDAVLMQYTSGTTSFPKGVLLCHESMVLDAWHAGRRMGLRAGDRYFSGRPLFHVSGTTLSMLASLLAGACYLTTPSFDVAKVIEIMETENCTMTSANDTMFQMLMAHSSFKPERLSLRGGLIICTPEIARQVMSKLGMPDLCTGYGLSEASPNVALSPYDDVLEKRIAGYAFPLPGLEVSIFDPDDGTRRGPNEPGEIRVRGWALMLGYYKMPEATAQAIDAEGWLHTGDLGVADADGRIRFVDRLKDMFRVGGENVAPADIENVLNQHPAVRHSQVVGVPDPRRGEVAAAFVIIQSGHQVDEETLIAWCAERCAGFKVPRYIRFVDSFDNIGMTGSAKIQRNRLREYAIKVLDLTSGTSMQAKDTV